MGLGTREPRRAGARAAVAAAVALALLAGCSNGARQTASPSPSVTATTSGLPSATPTPSPTVPLTGQRWVLGVIGDFGVDDKPVRQVVAAMKRFNGTRPLDAVVTTGDNAYCCGKTGQAAFARNVLDPLLGPRTPVYASLGNHDAVTSGGAPVMAAFGMASRWYTAVVGPVQLVVLDANHTSDPRQLRFIRRTLGARRPVPFRVVVFHQPGWSCSAHPPDPGVVSRWLPLFGTRVDLVLTGHNHTYERFSGPDGTPYVTTGGGGAALYPSARLACRGPLLVEYLNTVHHAVRITATATGMLVEGVDTGGNVFDAVSVVPR
jgi:hypothetical protein